MGVLDAKLCDKKPWSRLKSDVRSIRVKGLGLQVLIKGGREGGWMIVHATETPEMVVDDGDDID